MLIVIEHLEPVLSRWVWYEYMHAAEIMGVGNLIITNVKNKKERRKIAELCGVYPESVRSLPFKNIIILDPSADTPLKPEDCVGSVIVIGGILGDYPPQNRTRKLLDFDAERRHIGEHQFSIDGAVYMTKKICEGNTLETIPVEIGLTIQVSEEHEIYLPYAYPLSNGRPVFYEKLKGYLMKDIEKDEEIAFKTGRMPSVIDDEMR